MDVPAGMTVSVVKNTDKKFQLLLPQQPTGELSEDDLKAVAGGAFSRARS